jgi:methionine synthase I (cobalamin-dependent)
MAAPPFPPAPDGLLLLDGAMGSELVRRGLPTNPVAILTTHAATVSAIHADYAAAGAKVHLTATFQLNPITLEATGDAPRLSRLVERALLLARRAAGADAIILGDLGPLYDPATNHEITDFDVLHETAACFGHADGLLLETTSTLDALRAVAYLTHKVEEVADRPVLLSIAYRKDGVGRYRSASGHGPEVFARHAARHGVAVLGVNCGRDIGPADLVAILQVYRQETDLPLLVRGNAGTPWREGDGWVYPLGPAEFGAWGPAWRAAGASLIGGCCGTTPAHIRALGEALAPGIQYNGEEANKPETH